MKFNKDFREFIELLNDRKVKYLVVGGYAVNLHGYPRYTKDIDFWINPTQKNIRMLLSVLKDFGFGSLDLAERNFMNPDNIIQLGHAPYRIDLLMDIDGISFGNCFQNREKISVEGTHINFLNIEDLIKAKKTSGRSQDLADAEHLEKIKEKE